MRQTASKRRAIEWTVASRGSDRRRRVAVTLSLVMLLLSGCTVGYRHLQNPDGFRANTMFGRWGLEMGGNVTSRYDFQGISCDIIYLGQLSDSTNYDTIPVIVIDSFCFSGSCMANDTCAMPYVTTPAFAGRYFYNRSQVTRPIGHEDLPFSRCVHYDDPTFPKACDTGTIYVDVYARLFDRVEWVEIASESKRFKLKMTRNRSVYPED